MEKKGIYEITAADGTKYSEEFTAKNVHVADEYLRKQVQALRKKGVVLKPMMRYKLTSGRFEVQDWIQLEI